MQRYIKCYTPVSALLEMLLVTVLYVFVGIKADIFHDLTSSKQYIKEIPTDSANNPFPCTGLCNHHSSLISSL
jgi:hypothetical protein